MCCSKSYNFCSSVLADSQIRVLALDGMITPFADYGDIVKKKGCASAGLSSAGYDLRVQPKAKVLRNPKEGEFLTISNNNDYWLDVEADDEGYVTIPANSVGLFVSVERFSIPNDIVTTALTKSSYARFGVFANITPFEPGWVGYPTIEIANLTPYPVKIMTGDSGVAQVMFWKLSELPEKTYEAKGGSYHNQTAEVVHSR